MSTTLRLLSVRLLLVLLGVALAAVALIATVSPTGSGHHGTTLGAGQRSGGTMQLSNTEWN